MSRIKTIIVEDELIIAEDIKEMLHELQYEVIGIASDCREAEEILVSEVPEIALIDIQLRDGDDGLQLGKSIKEKYKIPVIFITSYSDRLTVEKAKQIHPEGYLVKPFEKEDLFTSIEIAISNYYNESDKEPDKNKIVFENIVIRDSIFIRKDYMLIKIKFDDLEWIKSDGNYLELFCREAKHLVRSSLKEFIQKLPSHLFIQVHKSFCININFITAVEYSSITLGKTSIPVGRSFIEHIKQVLNIEF